MTLGHWVYHINRMFVDGFDWDFGYGFYGFLFSDDSFRQLSDFEFQPSG